VVSIYHGRPEHDSIPVGVGCELHWQHRSCFCAIASLNLSRVSVSGLQCVRGPISIDRRLGLLQVHISVLFEVQDQVVQ
jgi:hypothetical protein